ncbi:hypothetical protein MMEU_1320 [Mycobacterium marinum str. Europe]|nr:hypothetical protein MMEU_1320 [Mycobacterium marinum str. Europe]
MVSSTSGRVSLRISLQHEEISVVRGACQRQSHSKNSGAMQFPQPLTATDRLRLRYPAGQEACAQLTRSRP